MKIEYMHPADQLVMFMSRIYERGLTTTSGGNLSIRDENNDIWITPAGIDKGTLTRADIICVKPDGTCIGPHKPSSELPFHTSVYKKRPDLNAVLHAHPPALVAFSIARKLPDMYLIPSVSKACGRIAMAKYALPGSSELGENIAKEFVDGTDIVLLENHGVCIGAEDLFAAFMKFETLEYSANLEILANKVGKPQSLTPEDIAITDTDYHRVMDDFIPHSHSPEEQAARRDMITLIHRSYQQGLFNATHGTYSVRLSDGSFIITPFGRDRAYLQEEDLVRIKNGMKEQGKIPSRAVRFHEMIYHNNPDINAVLLAHPMHVMAFAVTDAKFDPRTIPESYILLREITKEPYESIFGMPEEASKKFSNRVPALIFQNDSVVVTGGTLLQAFDRLEVAEATAASIIGSKEIGKIVHITEKEIDDLKTAFHLHD
ncbi:MAG TPA: class II aldolase/adducin family protein [Oscillospiraceae bacterium]|nr:class II aldolase/adducin family protein [Oscillospiraceae bacterium]HPF55569.1 class II aldolase/adducin family protein [Clostridiales bacterium]HPK34644.1 class II aldolase/adducin family protein [Oscillospiraceae bacterium]HPR74591.1 class II aldolase/adducin family protein [Oscillospiraceae bacterium]